MFINARQLRAARGLLDWSQAKLAEKAGLTQQSIASLEKEKHFPQKATIKAIRNAFHQAGVEFTEDGVRYCDNFQTVIEGPDSYLKLLDDVFHTLREHQGEVLFRNSDERKSPSDVNNSLRRIRNAGIPMRSIVAESNNYLLGSLDEYRTIPDNFVSYDVSVIYSDKVAFVLHGEGPLRILVIKNVFLAEDLRGTFEILWHYGSSPRHSSAEEGY